MSQPHPTSVDPAEIARFEALASQWWDPEGKLKPLHRLNPTRLTYLRDKIAGHFGRDTTTVRPFGGLRLLDIGCGGGLVSEPFARLGASVVGIDAAARNIGIARAHAREFDLAIDYREAAAEELAADETFDVVLALEVVEHVADLDSFLATCARLVRPGGALFVGTLNRTPQAYALAIIGAEYVMGWLPRGTHDWNKFVRPSELAAGLRPHGVQLRDLSGLSYALFADEWRVSRDLSVNYLAYGVK
jgi:2-polyprenyl-6-hydroxyphenyl methylase / 3-demethylubiquinone-9 3-methyltransferase